MRASFLETEHGQIPCQQCHGGDPEDVNWQTVHQDVIRDPTFPDPSKGCADCHESIVDAAHHSLHYTNTPMRSAVAARISMNNPDLMQTINRAFDRHCSACHAELDSTGNRHHAQHVVDLACQVCHAQANKNCFQCHVGTDNKGLPYFKCKETQMLFKIGRNPQQTADRPFKYMVLRHVPATPALFDSYAKNALDRFDSRPTWKRDAPHSIQRRTPQNNGCNNCHGNTDLFLRSEDVTEWERRANEPVIVPEANLPQSIKEVKDET